MKKSFIVKKKMDITSKSMSKYLTLTQNSMTIITTKFKLNNACMSEYSVTCNRWHSSLKQSYKQTHIGVLKQ